jgi:hypothetical protein
MLSSTAGSVDEEGIRHVVHFEGLDGVNMASRESEMSMDDGHETGGIPIRGIASFQQHSNRSLLSAPAAPPHAHRRTSLVYREAKPDREVRSRDQHAFGSLSLRHAIRSIRQEQKFISNVRRGRSNRSGLASSMSSYADGTTASEETRLIKGGGDEGLEDPDGPWEALRGMILDNKINVLFAFLPLAYWSHAAGWSDGSVFILNFLAMVPLASLLGVFTEELAAHTNDVIGGLINATFGNAVELVVAIQALLHNGEKNTSKVAQFMWNASLINSHMLLHILRLPSGPIEFDRIGILQPAASFGNVLLLRWDVLP